MMKRNAVHRWIGLTSGFMLSFVYLLLLVVCSCALHGLTGSMTILFHFFDCQVSEPPTDKKEEEACCWLIVFVARFQQIPGHVYKTDSLVWSFIYICKSVVVIGGFIASVPSDIQVFLCCWAHHGIFFISQDVPKCRFRSSVASPWRVFLLSQLKDGLFHLHGEHLWTHIKDDSCCSVSFSTLCFLMFAMTDKVSWKFVKTCNPDIHRSTFLWMVATHLGYLGKRNTVEKGGKEPGFWSGWETEDITPRFPALF